MSALGKLVVSLALDHAQYTQGLDRSSQEALKFAQNSQKSFDQAGRSAKEFLGNVAGNIGGAIVSVVGLNAAFSRVTESINILNSLDDAAQKTGSSIEDLSKIEQVARNFGDVFNPIEQGITRLAKGLAEIDDPSSNAIRALDAIGVSARDSNGELRTAADVYIDVARSLQQYEDGTKKTAVAQALFGKSGAELLPMLNNLAQGVDHVTGVTRANASQAALFNDQLALGKARVTGFFTSLAVDLLPTLNNIASAVNNSTGQIGSFSSGSSVAVSVLKGLAIAAFTVVDTFRGMGREIGARAAQLAALASMDFSGAKFIGQALAEDNMKSRAEYDKFVDTVLNGEQKIAQAVDSGGTKKAIDFQVKLPDAVNASTNAIEKQTKAFDIELHKLKEYESEAKRARDITESVATKQERYNQTLEELERLRPHMSVEAYTRALDKAERELQDVGTVNRQVTSEMDQLWIQAGRNIQSTFANSIFDFFNDGLDGMWNNAKSAVGRILSEFAALKLSQSIGLSALFAVPGSVGAAGGIGGTGAAAAGGASLLSNIGSGAGIMSLLKGGASGITSGISGIMSGGGLGALALPLLGGFALNSMSNAFAGDKTLGNGFTDFMQKIPVLGAGWDIVAGLFGRGPMKQQGTSLTGQIGASGFESGSLSTRFKAKGGLFRSDKIDFAAIDAVTGAVSTDNGKLAGFANDLAKVAKDTFSLINETTQQTSSSLRSIADDLGISSDSIDNFSYSVSILSDKGKMLTDEQISEEIAKISDTMARGLVPQVDSLAKRGESALQTVARLGTEFDTLSSGAMNLGASLDYAKQLVKGMGFEARTALIELSGGAEALASKTQFFAQNFLTDAEKLAPVQEALKVGLVGLGYSANITKDQFKALVQDVNLSNETRNKLLDLAPAFITVSNAAAVTSGAMDGTAATMQSLSANMFGAQKDAESQRVNSSIQEITNSITQLEGIAAQLRGTVNSINPLSVADARRIVSAGNPNDPNLQAALSTLSGMGSDSFSNVLDFQRAKALNVSAIGSLQDSIDSTISSDYASIDSLKLQEINYRNNLDSIAREMVDKLPRYATGSSYIAKTGPAILHQGERVINPKQNQDLVDGIMTLVKKIEEGTVSAEALRRMLREAMVETDDGLALRQTAAA